MNLVDSPGWIEYFSGGPLSDKYAQYLQEYSQVLTPTIVLYEVYKKIKKDFGEETAIHQAAQMQKTRVLPLIESIAFTAADVSIKHSLPMADAIVYATAREEKCKIVTSNSHFKGLPDVIFVE
ncbi:MAG: type II toxin-antitoxin system VapC family toxin [Armatimonadetes bacterium]|nr:type II toxin-antitoxin system VapC family toxin [Armatimonadota bacterium]